MLSSSNLAVNFLLFSSSLILLSSCSWLNLLLACRSSTALSSILYSLSSASWLFLSSSNLCLCFSKSCCATLDFSFSTLFCLSKCSSARSGFSFNLFS